MKKTCIILLSMISLFFGQNLYAEEKCEYKYANFSIESKNNISTIVNNGIDSENKIIDEYKKNINEFKKNIYIKEEIGKYYIINNGVKTEGYEYIVKLIIFFDGKHFAYIVREGNSEYVVLNGEKSKKYKKISLQHIEISTEGDFVFIGITKNGKNKLVKNLIEIDDNAFSPRFSYNSNQFGYIKKENGRQLAVINGVKSKSFDKIRVYKTLNDKIIYEIRNNTSLMKYNDSVTVLYDKDGNIVKHYFYLECKNNTLSKKIINNSEKSKLIKQLVISKIKLKKSRFSKFVPKFEKLISKVSNNKLLKIDKKLAKFSKKIRENKKYKYILNYLEAKIKLEIIERELKRLG